MKESQFNIAKGTTCDYYPRRNIGAAVIADDGQITGRVLDWTFARDNVISNDGTT